MEKNSLKKLYTNSIQQPILFTKLVLKVKLTKTQQSFIKKCSLLIVY